MKETVLVSATRTAVGDFGGSLKDLAPTDMGVETAKAAISRAGIIGGIGAVVILGSGCETIHFASKGACR